MAEPWRLIYKPRGDTADMVAYASGIAEGKFAGKFMGSAKRPPNTLIIQGVKKRGVIVGADVFVRKNEAEARDMEVARRPRVGRGGAVPTGTLFFQEMVVKAKSKAKAARVDPEALSLLMYTSGTTGKPKGVMLWNRGLLNHAEACATVLGIEKEDKVLIVLPMYHAYALNALTMASVLRGATMVIIPQYDPVRLVEVLRETKATFFCAVPTIFMHLLQVARKMDLDIPKTIRTTLSAAAPIPVEVLREFEKVFGTRIVEAYGMTECTALASMNPVDAPRIGSVGLPVSKIAPEVCDLELKIVDEEGREQGVGESGEILIRSAKWGMKGYYNRPDATAETLRDGWIYSGDVGYRDEDGYYFIVDRKKDMIITGGFNVYPREIEEAICTHRAVMEATLIGVPDDVYGEVGRALVVLKDGEESTPEEILEHCRANLAKYKIPRSVEFREYLPKTPSGKVLKKELRDGYIDDRLIEKREGKE